MEDLGFQQFRIIDEMIEKTHTKMMIYTSFEHTEQKKRDIGF